MKSVKIHIIRKHKTLIILLLGFISMAWMDPLNELKPLLPDLPGWHSHPVTGTSSYQNAMKIISVSRRYTQDKQSFHAYLIITDQSSLSKLLEIALQFKSSASSIKNERIDGFQTYHLIQKSKKEITLLVVIQKQDTGGIYLVLKFKNSSLEKAWGIAKQFDWNYIEFIVSSLDP